MGLIAFLKYAVNSTIGTDYFKSIDQLIGAKLVCRGYTGTTFTISNALENFFKEFTLEIKEDTPLVPNFNYLKEFIVPLPLGTYHVKVTNEDGSDEQDIVLDTNGRSHIVEYFIEHIRYTSAGTYTMPEGMDEIFVSAIAGGGGGGGGRTYYDGSANTTRTGAGGSGGGAGNFVFLQRVPVTALLDVAITIGAAGAAGAKNAAGKAGGSTVFGSFFTLAGGTGGANNSTRQSLAGNAGTGGAAGGKGGNGHGGVDYNETASKGSAGSKLSSDYNPPNITLSGTGGAAGSLLNYTDSYTAGSGGGGAAGLFPGSNGGKGGNGSGRNSSATQTAATAGANGTGYGSGGGGGGGQSRSDGDTYLNAAGGKGAPGIVVIYKGVRVA